MASEPRCSKPGCGALKIVGKPCTDADCPQQWVHHTDTRPAPAATDTGLETVDHQYWHTQTYEWLPTGFPDRYRKDGFLVRELVTRSQAEELLAAERAAQQRLLDIIEEANDDKEALEAKLAAAEKALEPFATHANARAVDDTGWRDKETVKIVVSIGDLRKARAVLGGKPS